MAEFVYVCVLWNVGCNSSMRFLNLMHDVAFCMRWKPCDIHLRSGFNRWQNTEAVSSAELHGSGVNRWLNMEVVSTAELHGSGFNRWLNMEVVSTAELHGSGFNRWLNVEVVSRRGVAGERFQQLDSTWKRYINRCVAWLRCQPLTAHHGSGLNRWVACNCWLDTEAVSTA